MTVRHVRGRGQGVRAFLLRWSAVPLAMVIALSTTASYVVARRYADRAFDTALFDTARTLARQAEVGRADLDDQPIARAIIEFDPVDRVFYRISDLRSGRIIAANAEIVIDAVEPSADDSLAMADGRVGRERVRAVLLKVPDKSGRTHVEVIYAETLKKRDILGERLFSAVVIPQILIALAAGVLVWLGVRAATRPLERLAADLMLRGPLDLGRVSTARTIREVRLLGVAVNRLIHRLRRSGRAQQAFIGNAAHQLRTPLAGIVAQAERLAGEQDPERIRHAAAQLQLGARRATRLVNQLLTLARSGPDGKGAIALHSIDLSQVVRATCAERVPEALAAGVDLGYAGPEVGVTIQGDESLMREMLANLIDNAIRYGAHPGVVTVHLELEPPALSVEDDGPGIPEEESHRVFMRFYRLPGSQAGGSGLGLAIVREIAALHGATVAVRPGQAGRGTVVTVDFTPVPDG